MPRFARKSRRRTGDDATKVQRLLTGYYMEHCPFGDADSMRAGWIERRDVLVRQWVRDRPGSRPWGWWHHDAPEPRQRIDGKPHPFDCKERTLHIAESDRKDFWEKAYALAWGMPTSFIPPFDEDLYRDFMRNILSGRDSEIFEPEWNYLVRLNLLLPEDSP